jgi:hypothetical protein
MFSAAIFRMTLRQLVGRHRWGTLLMVLVLAAMPAAVALLIPQRPQVGIELVKKLLVPWLVPALVLLGGATVLREEIQHQTFVYLYLKPISRLGLVAWRSRRCACALSSLPEAQSRSPDAAGRAYGSTHLTRSLSACGEGQDEVGRELPNIPTEPDWEDF